MTALAAILGMAWGGLVLALARAVGPLPSTVRALASRDGGASSATGAWRRWVVDERVQMAMAAAVGLAVSPKVALLAAGAVWAWPRWQARRAERARLDAIERGLPDVVDLLVLAVGAGANVSQAVAAVGRRGLGPLARLFEAASADVARGRRLADALDEVAAQGGDALYPLVAALLAGERYGVSLTEGLDRLAVDVRAQRRRRAEAAARRVPVQLLFPLVTCILPAFALLTVAPLIASALRGLLLR